MGFIIHRDALHWGHATETLMMKTSCSYGKSTYFQCLIITNSQVQRPFQVQDIWVQDLCLWSLGTRMDVRPSGECAICGGQQRGPNLFPKCQRTAVDEIGQGPALGNTWIQSRLSQFPITAVNKFLNQETMTHSTLQRIFSVLNCKSRMERLSGPMSILIEWKLSIRSDEMMCDYWIRLLPWFHDD